MLPGNNNLREAAHIAEELLDDQALETERKCESIERAVTGKIMSLQQALAMYKADMDSYINYIVNKHANSFSAQLAEESGNILLGNRVKATEKLLNVLFGDLISHEDLAELTKSFSTFASRLAHNQVVLK